MVSTSLWFLRVLALQLRTLSILPGGAILFQTAFSFITGMLSDGKKKSPLQ